MVLHCCERVHYWDEFEPDAQFCWILPSMDYLDCPGLSSPAWIASLLSANSTVLPLQISKLSMIPVVCVMEWILHNKHYTREVKMAVVVVVIGVGVCTVTDVKVNAKGFLCACLAVLSTSLQQIVSTYSYFLPAFLSLEMALMFDPK